VNLSICYRPSFALFYWMTWAWPDDVIRPRSPSSVSYDRITRERTLTVADNVGVAFLYGAYSPVEFELILSVKMKTRDHLVVNFRRSVLRSYDGPKSQYLEIFKGIFAFWNDPLRWNIQNSDPKVFIATPIDVVVIKVRKNLSDGESVKSCVI